ncbi:MAG: hypothetical protein K2W99_07205 [Chthoniobacterales bacterium]|nr:hypothetical protein [Chthoniobacterales bacterium]
MPQKTTTKNTKKTTSHKKNVVSKKTLSKPLTKKEHTVNDRLAKEAIKLIDTASDFLRKSVKQSHRTTDKARDTFHKEAHALLGKASRHLEDLLESSTSALRKAINKV